MNGEPGIDLTNAGCKRLQELSGEIARIAADLEGLAFATQADEPGIEAAFVRAMIRSRRMRAQYFDAALFPDPAWDMMLDLLAAHLEGRRVAVSSLCIAAAVPTTTALRWIGALHERGLVARTADPADGRRVFVCLTDRAAERLQACLREIHGSYPVLV